MYRAVIGTGLRIPRCSPPKEKRWPKTPSKITAIPSAQTILLISILIVEILATQLFYFHQLNSRLENAVQKLDQIQKVISQPSKEIIHPHYNDMQYNDNGWIPDDQLWQAPPKPEEKEGAIEL